MARGALWGARVSRQRQLAHKAGQRRHRRVEHHMLHRVHDLRDGPGSRASSAGRRGPRDVTRCGLTTLGRAALHCQARSSVSRNIARKQALRSRTRTRLRFSFWPRSRSGRPRPVPVDRFGAAKIDFGGNRRRKNSTSSKSEPRSHIFRRVSGSSNSGRAMNPVRLGTLRIGDQRRLQRCSSKSELWDSTLLAACPRRASPREDRALRSLKRRGLALGGCVGRSGARHHHRHGEGLCPGDGGVRVPLRASSPEKLGADVFRAAVKRVRG